MIAEYRIIPFGILVGYPEMSFILQGYYHKRLYIVIDFSIIYLEDFRTYDYENNIRS